MNSELYHSESKQGYKVLRTNFCSGILHKQLLLLSCCQIKFGPAFYKLCPLAVEKDKVYTGCQVWFCVTLVFMVNIELTCCIWWGPVQHCNKLLHFPLLHLGLIHRLQSLRVVPAPSGVLSMSFSGIPAATQKSTATVSLMCTLPMGHNAFRDIPIPDWPYPQS